MTFNDFLMDSTEFFNLLTPSLEKSEEAYFGKDAPLAKDLINNSTKLKELVGTDNNIFKDKKFIAKLKLFLDNFGKIIAKDINAEKVYMAIRFDRYTQNAEGLSLLYMSDALVEKDNVTYLSYDKLAELEDIVITSEGYKFRNSKGKILCIVINHSLIQNNNPEEISAVIAHEIGHAFQQGVFGIYKMVADHMLASKIDVVQKRLDGFGFVNNKVLSFFRNHTIIGKVLHHVLSYILFPDLLEEGIFAKIGAAIYKLCAGKQLSQNKYLLKEQLRKMDEGDSTVLHGTMESTITKRIISVTGKPGNKDKYIKQDLKDIDEINSSITDTDDDLNVMNELKTSKNVLVNFFRSVSKDVELLRNNFLHFLLLSDYTTNTYEKISFRKRWEFFADVFATSYGFSPNMYKFLIDANKSLDDYENFYDVGINKIPFIRAIYKTQMYIHVNRYTNHDNHGTLDQRAQNMYTALVQELKTNPDLTQKQKDEIKQQIDLVKAANDIYYKDKAQTNGFWFKYYNKLIDNRINDKNGNDTEEYILEPIKEICREEI